MGTTLLIAFRIPGLRFFYRIAHPSKGEIESRPLRNIRCGINITESGQVRGSKEGFKSGSTYEPRTAEPDGSHSLTVIVALCRILKTND